MHHRPWSDSHSAPLSTPPQTSFSVLQPRFDCATRANSGSVLALLLQIDSLPNVTFVLLRSSALLSLLTTSSHSFRSTLLNRLLSLESSGRSFDIITFRCSPHLRQLSLWLAIRARQHPRLRPLLTSVTDSKLLLNPYSHSFAFDSECARNRAAPFVQGQLRPLSFRLLPSDQSGSSPDSFFQLVRHFRVLFCAEASATASFNCPSSSFGVF
jgi:hypothetical protein